MSVQTAPLAEPSATPSLGSLAAAFGALVAAIALLWAIGTAGRDGNTTVVRAGVSAGNAEAVARQTPAQARLLRLNTPVGHHGEYRVQYADLPKRTQAQLDVVRRIIERYPTAAVAEKAGWHRATTNLKGIAAHYMRNGVAGFITIDDKFDVGDPEILLFDGEGPNAPIVGVSYLVNGAAPAAFSGKWDVWHNHQAVCFAGGYVIGELGGHADSEINMTPQQCAAKGGTQFPIANLNMLHVWMKPGFASSAGVFSHDHPRLR
jgi:hypothetical protein